MYFNFKSFYTTKLPVVTTSVLEEKYIEHIVEADGIVVEGGKQAVTTLAGLRVESLMVHVGDRVEEGDVLFKIDLDDLKEIMKENQTQIDKLQLQVNAILKNQELARQKKKLKKPGQGKTMTERQGKKIPTLGERQMYMPEPWKNWRERMTKQDIRNWRMLYSRQPMGRPMLCGRETVL